MTQHDGDCSPQEERLDEAIASYLRAKESGTKPDCQQWLTRYPEFAPELAEFFADEDRIDAMVGRLHPDRAESSVAHDASKHPRPSHEEDGPQSTVTYRARPPRVVAHRYVVKNFHARGGMGEIWLAEDGEIGREVALKRLRGEREDQRERFLAEAQITGQLEHPGIVPLHDLGVDEDGHPFYVMKYVHGPTLKDAILEYHSPFPSGRHVPRPPDGQSPMVPREVQRLRLVEVFVDLCQAVAFAHSRGVLHRDLKPSNIMLGRFGETLLLDWGLAKITAEPGQPGDLSYVHVGSSSGSTETQEGSVVGSPAYMSPEVAEGRITEVDETTDVYLLGATLYEILSGRPPREGSSNLEMVELARNVTPTAPRKLDPTVPRALEAICLKAMARRKQDRYRTALEVAEDVQRYLAGEPVSAYRESFRERAWRWCKRHQRLLKRSVAAAVVVALVLSAFLWIRRAERRAEQAERREQALKEQKRAQSEVERFRGLADEMRFYAASSDPPDEHAPYYDLQRGLHVGQAALDLAGTWGPELGQLPLPKDRAGLKEELYGLHLLMVQARLQDAHAPNLVEDSLKLLDRATTFRKPTQGYYRLRAKCSKRLGERQRSLEEGKMAVDPRIPTTALDHFLRGEEHRMAAARGRDPDSDPWKWGLKRGDLVRAMDEYRAGLQKEPNHFWSHLQLGRCLLSVGREAEAVEALGACVALRPDSPWGYSARGIALALTDRFDEAVRDLDHAVAIDPQFYPARLNRGVAYWLDKPPRKAKAVADFSAVLKAPKEKRLIEAAYYRGQVYLKQREYAAALKDFEQVVKQRPGFPDVYRIRAELYFLQGDNQQAIDDLNTFFALASSGPFDEDTWQAHHQRGRWLLRYLLPRLPAAPKERSSAIKQLAKTELQAAIEKGGRSATLFLDLGMAQQRLADPNEAIQAYSDGLDQWPGDVKLLIARGWAYLLRLQQYDEARNDFQKAVRLDPEYAEAHSGLGFLHAIRRSHADAEHQAVRALLAAKAGPQLDALGAGDYAVLHHVACIYAELSQSDAQREQEYLDLTIDVIRRALDVWKRGGSGQPNELESIRQEESFPPALRNRPDFQDLFR